MQRSRDRAVDAGVAQRSGRRRDDVVEGGGARIAVALLVDQHEWPVALQRLVHLAAERLRPLPRRKGGAVHVQQKGARRTRLGRGVRAAQLLATGLGDPSRHRSRAGVVPREVDVKAPLGRERRRRRAEEVAREEDGLVCAGRLPRAKQLGDEQPHRAHLEGPQPVPRHQRRREDMLAQLVGALGTVDVERHSAVRRVRLQQQNQRPLPLNRGAQLAQAVAGAHVVGGGCAVGDGGRARQQHDHGLRVAHMLLQPRGVVQVVHVQEGRDVLDIPLQLPLERLCLVLPARPHVGEEDVVPVHRGQSVTRWGVAKREAAGEHRPSGSPIAEMTRALLSLGLGLARVTRRETERCSVPPLDSRLRLRADSSAGSQRAKSRSASLMMPLRCLRRRCSRT
mmetsp:Transcript_28043/g.94191  ORF Transcript_28043/g.94191 Transcript_28043/m.94191 type:complete len:395 (-) Transcript_28043:1938-3122(-)